MEEIINALMTPSWWISWLFSGTLVSIVFTFWVRHRESNPNVYIEIDIIFDEEHGQPTGWQLLYRSTSGGSANYTGGIMWYKDGDNGEVKKRRFGLVSPITVSSSASVMQAEISGSADYLRHSWNDWILGIASASATGKIAYSSGFPNALKKEVKKEKLFKK